MNGFNEQYRNEDFILLAVDVNEPYNVVEEFIDRVGDLNFPVLLDTSGNEAFEWEFNPTENYAPFPRQFLVDKEGYVQYMSNEYLPEALSQKIDEMLSE